MLKHKKFLSLLLVLPLFSITSCQKATEKYTVLKEGQEGNNLTCEFPASWKEVHKAPFNLEDEFVDLNVTFNNVKLTKVAKKLEDAKQADTFFICTSDSVPSKSIINNFKVNKTNTDINTTLTFYVAHLEYKDESKDSKVHLSKKVTIKVYNEGAFMGPWFIPVVSVVIALAVVAMVFFTHRYKAKKEGKL